MQPVPIVVSAAVEGPTDEAILRRIITDLGLALGPGYGRAGKPSLLRSLAGYNHAAEIRPWIVLVDLGQDAECAPPARMRWLSEPAAYMCFRIAVREVESWLLADRETLAGFVGVARSRIPAEPESLGDPKAVMVNLALCSRRQDIRVDMVPRPASGRSIGPAYTSRLIEYAQGMWRPDVAAQHADSLMRLCKRVTECIEKRNQ
jgi:hypothetical protein